MEAKAWLPLGIHRDPPLLERLSLRQIHREYAVVEIGADLLRVDVVGYRERAVVITDAILSQQEMRLRRRRHPATDLQFAVFKADIDILRLHTRQIDIKQHVV